MTEDLLGIVQEAVAELREARVHRNKCLASDHSKGFCGDKCYTLREHIRTDVYSSGSDDLVRLTHMPTGITHSHSTRDYSIYMAHHLCLDKIAKELRYLADPYDID